MITFAHPWFFLLLLPWLLLTVFMLKRPGASVRISSTIAFSRTGKKRRKLTALEIALLITMLLTITALARPRRPEGTGTIRAQGVDIILALDMSGSMECFDRPSGMSEEKFIRQINDSQTLNRLETAKKFAT